MAEITGLSIWDNLGRYYFRGLPKQYFCIWAYYFYKEQSVKYTECRHRSSRFGSCRSFGTRDENKYDAVRASTIEKHMASYVGSPNEKHANRSTKCRSYHIAFFARLWSKDEEYINSIFSKLCGKKYVIRHMCGCKCARRKHLALGSYAENQSDVGMHALLNHHHGTDTYEVCLNIVKPFSIF